MDKAEFKKILKKVEKPARYLGNEINTVHKDTSNKNLIRYDMEDLKFKYYDS